MSKLILIPTPVGNLADMTYRAVETLKTIDLLLAEDTRQTKKLLEHYGITVNLRPHHQHNEHKDVTQLVNQLKQGKTIGLVSDAGTPGISDPGFLLTRACLEAGIEVECLPGATAFLPALVVSGLPCEKFCFEGFLPHKKGRNKRLTALQEETRTMVFYESPYRVVKTLTQFIEFFGEERKISVSREISKIYEEHVRGTLREALTHFQEHEPKGEFVFVLEGGE